MKNMIPCVGFELQYSPLERDCVENLAYSLHKSSNKFRFDVTTELEDGQEVLMLFSNKKSPTQHLEARVISCEKMNKDHFRLTLRTCPDSSIVEDKSEVICLPISRGPSTAQEMTLLCPSCKKTTPFHFIANQDGEWERGILPIYNCSSCGTTRAMPGLINRNSEY